VPARGRVRIGYWARHDPVPARHPEVSVFAPTSSSVVVLLLLACAALLFAVMRARFWVVQVAAGVGVVALGVTTGVVAVNDYFGYYTSWSEAYAGTFGGATATKDTIDTRQTGSASIRGGRVVSINLPGHDSGINRRGLVYLPPQYGMPQYRTVRFPVVELMHGTPGSPRSWTVEFDLARTVDTLLAQRAIGPMVFVMPDVTQGQSQQECLNYAGVRDDTYVSHDVVADVEHRFRVTHDRSQWAAVGYSSGGYCAANLALRHRHDYGAVASLDGYYWPADGPAIRRLAGDPIAQRQNDPLGIVETLRTGTVPMPQFWVSAGTGSADDYHSAKAFVTALSRFEGVTFVAQPGANHNFYAWRDQLQQALRWVWSAVTPPALRVEFPTGGPVRTATVGPDARATLRSKHPDVYHPPAVPRGTTAR
jgi:poly(3-hydroxybutyrate) depolymerase